MPFWRDSSAHVQTCIRASLDSTPVQEWVHKHYKNLTPLVTSAADALVSEFYQTVQVRMHEGWRLSVSQFARLLMRHPELSQHFGVCLQSYMTSVDQSRPGRNASYKVMNVATIARFQVIPAFMFGVCFSS